VNTTSAALRVGAPVRAGAFQALRAEWIKLRTVRSTFWSLLTLVLISVLFTALACWESETLGSSRGGPDSDVVLDSLTGIWFGQIALVALAVLAITSEYSTGMIRTTLAVNPRRRTVLVTKTAVVATVAFVVGLATSLACFLVGQPILRGNGFNAENGYPTASLADGAALRAVVGTALCLALLAVLALGVGAILRHTAGALTVMLTLLLAPVIAIGFLPENIAEQVEKLAPLSAALAVQQTVQLENMIPLGPWAGLGVVGAYAAAAVVLALVLIGRRDA
jgi:ABC-2 type transport system permease protein